MEQSSASVLNPSFAQSRAYPVSLAGQWQYVSRHENSLYEAVALTNFDLNFDQLRTRFEIATSSCSIRTASTGSRFSAASMTTALLLHALRHQLVRVQEWILLGRCSA